LAGLFGSMFDPTRVGPGVNKNAPKKKRFFLFFELYFRKFSKILGLNFIYILCCIPIITIGPATAGLAYCMRNISREEHTEISDFFDQFKKNFWQSLVTWIIFTLAFIAVIFGLIFYGALIKQGSFLGYAGFALCALSGIIVLFMSYYVYMIIVTFKVNFRQLFKNSFIFAIIGLGRNIITTIIISIIIGWFAIYFLFPVVYPLYHPEVEASISSACLAVSMFLFFIPSLVSFIINFNAYPNVKKFMIDPTLAKMPKEEEEAIFED